MGVPCPGCGREYDVTLFAFGRTLHCTCGSRVGLGPRLRSLDPLDPPRFAADAMLGRLARWLRILGFDTAYRPEVDDAELVRIGLAERRAVLTRDRRLPVEWRLADVYVVRAERTREQLREVIDAFSLRSRARPLSRCTRCNAILVAVAPEAVRGLVPARVWREQSSFRRCPSCERVYWPGSHAARILRALEELGAGSSARRADP